MSNVNSGVFYASMSHFVFVQLANSLEETVAFLVMKDSLNLGFQEDVNRERETEQLSESRRSALRRIIHGSIVLIAADLLGGDSLQASIEREGRKDFVDTVEINVFGDEPIRTSIIYRDPDGSIIDWRWYTDPKQIPRSLGDGRYIAIWEDQRNLRTVLCWHVKFSPTKEDIELQERAILPAERRRKLSEK